MTCAYTNETNATRCCRPARFNSDYCIFHETDPNKQASSKRYAALLRVLDRKKDGNWTGFQFPSNFDSAEKYTVRTGINASYSSLGNFSLRNIEFAENVQADHLVSRGEFRISGHFSSVSSQYSRFCKKATFSGSASTSVNLARAEFHGATEFFGGWSGEFRLDGAIFLDFATFHGGWSITLVIGGSKQVPPKRNSLFLGNAILQNVKFCHPTRVRFITVSLERALLSGTDLIGAHFYDVLWTKYEKGRLGLYDERHALLNSDKTYQDRVLANIEAAYRNCRLALEKNHDFSTATDFYLGEMKTRQRRRKKGQLKLSSIESLYRLLSNYGASPSRALLVFALIAGIHFLLSQTLICQAEGVTCSASPSWSAFSDQAASTMRVVTLQRFLSGPDYEIPGLLLLDSIIAALAPIQLALVVLAVRARIRR